MISFFKRLFGKQDATRAKEGPDAQIEFEVKDLKKGFILDYDMRTWEVREVSTYTWDNGVKEYEFDIFDGKEKLYLGYAPTDDTLNIFREGVLDNVWPEARRSMREDSDNMRKGSFQFEGQDYHYAAEGTAMIRNSREKFEMQNWLYESADAKKLISFNKYEDNTLGVFTGEWLEFYQISNILPRA